MPGCVYHVTARGNERRPIFRETRDREDYLARLATYRERFGFALLAFCLMDNHVHLAVERGETPLSTIMHALQSSYSQSFNRRHARVGHLFQGRYRAFLVQTDLYLAALLRYIHLNPVRAGIVRRAAAYRWSSDRFYRAGTGPAWVDVGRGLRLLGRQPDTAEPYRRLMRDPTVPNYEDIDPLEATVKGEKAFARTMLGASTRMPGPWRLHTVEEVVAAVASAERTAIRVLRQPGQRRGAALTRSIAAYVARNHARIPIGRVASYLGRDESTLIKGVRRLEQRLCADDGLRERIAAIAAHLKAGSQRPEEGTSPEIESSGVQG